MTHNNRFISFLKKHPPAQPTLPLVHMTNVTALGEIISDGELHLSECQFYNEELLYFFYGKPAYKIHGKTGAASKRLGDAAVAFVFDIKSMPDLHRVHAFDTGAAFGNRYDDYLPQGVQIKDFKLPPNERSLAQLVTAFFGNNRNYYVGDPHMKNSPAGLDVASQTYSDIVRSAVAIQFDDRACTCEIQFNKSIKIANASLMTVVIPDKVYDDLEVKAAFKAWGIKPVIYRMKRALPSERTEVVHEKLGDFYVTSGLI